MSVKLIKMTLFKSNKRFFNVVVAFVLFSILPLIQSCSNAGVFGIETTTLSKAERYLSISNIMNRNSFTDGEKAVFNKAQIRVVANIKLNKNGYYSLDHTTASKLNMDESLFNLFSELYNYAKVDVSGGLNITK